MKEQPFADRGRDKLMSQLPLDMAGPQQLVEHVSNFLHHGATFRGLAGEQSPLLADGRGDFIVREPWKSINPEGTDGGFLNLKFQRDRVPFGGEAIVDG